MQGKSQIGGVLAPVPVAGKSFSKQRRRCLTTFTCSVCSTCWRQTCSTSSRAVTRSDRSLKVFCSSLSSLSSCLLCWGLKSCACSEMRSWMSKAVASSSALVSARGSFSS